MLQGTLTLFAMSQSTVETLGVDTIPEEQCTAKPAIISWLVASISGILGISSVDYTGPLASALGGVDVSVIAPAIVGIAIYWLWDFIDAQ